jgi:hypothetical protein
MPDLMITGTGSASVSILDATVSVVTRDASLSASLTVSGCATTLTFEGNNHFAGIVCQSSNLTLQAVGE